jgi:N-acetylmuramoyl-L-alanine amidase
MSARPSNPQTPAMQPPAKPAPTPAAKPLAGQKICIDAGHGLGNSAAGRYDPGAVSGEHQEATIALEWANATGRELTALGADVIYTRPSRASSAPLRWRTQHAREQNCKLFVSFHLNASNGQGHGTETFYRHFTSRRIAKAINDALVGVLGTRDRGVKTEQSSARGSIHVLGFTPDSVLIELGFIDHASDREKVLAPANIAAGAKAIAEAIRTVGA